MGAGAFIRRGLLLALLACAPSAVAQDDGLAQIKERELERVRERISALKQSMDARAAERDRISRDLQAAEVEIAEKRARLAEFERQVRASEQRIADLDRRIAERERELAGETAELAAQVRAAYTSGRQERIRLLLNQDDPAAVGRLTAWYRYLSAWRGRTLDAVNAHLAELAALSSETGREHARLERLADSQRQELARLAQAQARRQELLVAVRAKMQEEGAEIERLAAEERDLTRLIAELATILSDYPITSEAPFSDLQGRLTWPVAGTLLHDFGQPRAGGSLRWNGVVLTAPRGREVRAVYHGRVVFADWLAGMGLLVIIDHGEEYMSLYGYNETVLKSAGDWVAPGDVIATVGESGGRPQPGLYFEIRKGRQPLNPRAWVTRSPGGG